MVVFIVVIVGLQFRYRENFQNRSWLNQLRHQLYLFFSSSFLMNLWLYVLRGCKNRLLNLYFLLWLNTLQLDLYLDWLQLLNTSLNLNNHLMRIFLKKSFNVISLSQTYLLFLQNNCYRSNLNFISQRIFLLWNRIFLISLGSASFLGNFNNGFVVDYDTLKSSKLSQLFFSFHRFQGHMVYLLDFWHSIVLLLL